MQEAPAVSAKGGKDVHAVVAAHPRDGGADCGLTDVAVQSRLGLLPRWHFGRDPDHRADLAGTRTTVTMVCRLSGASQASARARRLASGSRCRLAGQGLREYTGSPVLHGAVEDAQEGTGVAVPRVPCGRPQDRRWPRAAERPTAPTQGVVDHRLWLVAAAVDGGGARPRCAATDAAGSHRQELSAAHHRRKWSADRKGRRRRLVNR